MGNWISHLFSYICRKIINHLHNVKKIYLAHKLASKETNDL